MNLQAAINAGLFVKFVYDNWNLSSPTTNLNDLPVDTPASASVIPGKIYKVLGTVYANDLVTDINPRHAPLERYKTIGIVAQNQADAADVYLAIRGTESVWEWIEDAKFFLRDFPSVPGSGLTEDGFTDMYLSFSFTPGPSTSFIQDLRQLLPSNAMLTVTGHSLGAALATLCALDLARNTNFPVGLYTLASPRVGDLTFHQLFDHVVPNSYRVVNRLDLVPRLPPALLYFHVGDESELMPSRNLKLDLGCEHHLTSYLNMLGTLTGQAASYPIDTACVRQPPPSRQLEPS